MATLLCACSFEQMGFGNQNITFGTGSLDAGITDVKSTFRQDEDFMMEVILNKPFGVSDITFSINMIAHDGTEIIYDQWNDIVDPTWNYYLYELQIVELDGAFDQGDYILKLFTNEVDLIAEGRFTIQ